MTIALYSSEETLFQEYSPDAGLLLITDDHTESPPTSGRILFGSVPVESLARVTL